MKLVSLPSSRHLSPADINTAPSPCAQPLLVFSEALQSKVYFRALLCYPFHNAQPPSLHQSTPTTACVQRRRQRNSDHYLVIYWSIRPKLDYENSLWNNRDVGDFALTRVRFLSAR